MLGFVRRFVRKFVGQEAVSAQLVDVSERLNRLAQRIDERHDSLASREALDLHLKDLGGRLGGHEQRLEKIEAQLHVINGKQDQSLKETAIVTTDVLWTRAEILQDQIGFSTQFLSADVKYPIFNPSVLKWNDQILFVTRSSNLLDRRDGSFRLDSTPHNTINVLHRYTLDLKKISEELIDDSLTRTQCPNALLGLEDIRLFVWKDAVWALAAAIHPSEGSDAHAQQILIRLEGNRIVEFFDLKSPNPHAAQEKNWIPMVKDGRLLIIYNFAPVAVYEFTGEGLSLVHGEPPKDGNFPLRGGTPFVPWGNSFLSVAHWAPYNFRGKVYYLHLFVVMDDCFDIVEISEPFFIQRRGGEFATGLIEHDGDLLLCYGVSSRAAAFCKLPIAKLSRWILPY